MANPDLRVDMQIGGVWTDITSDAYGTVGISHTRGRSGEGAKADPAIVNMQLKSPNGKYDRRNPNSENFGKIGPNTPVRLSVDGADTVLDLPSGVQFSRASTPDHASLDITGDLDVRIDARYDDWTAWAQPLEMIGKYDSGASNQRSWMLTLWRSHLLFYWSPTGLAVDEESEASIDLPVPASGRLAVRVTLDVNDGAGGCVVTFYTAPTLAGPWTLLGTPTTVAGTTSILGGTAALTVGAAQGVSFETADGQVYGAEVRSGIGGTVVANPDFTAQTPGAGSFADGAGRLWTMSNGATLSNRRSRFLVEVPTWSPRFTVNGDDMYLPIQGGGILRRLGQGAKGLESTLRRRIPTYSPLAYWPMEEGVTAAQAYSPIAGVAPMTVSGFSWGADTTLAGSDALPTVSDSGRFFAGVRPGPTGEWRVELVYNLDEMPTTLTQMFLIRTTGTTPRIMVQVQTNNVRLQGQLADGSEVYLINVTAPQFTGQWNRLVISNNTVGGNVTARLGWVTIGEGGVSAPTTYAGSAGRVTSVEGAFGSGLQGMAMGHLSVFSTINSAALAYSYADHGFTGETAGARMIRLTAEEGVPFTLVGSPTDQTPMGPQRSDSLVNLLTECEASDGGILYEDRNRIGLVYRGRTTLYNQEPALVLPYAKVQQPFEPVDDDSRIRNDVTRSRPGGSSARVVREDGPLSVQAPPLGVGTYDESVAVNVAIDDQLEQVAGWAMHLGTWDEARYKSVRILLHKHFDLIPSVTALDVGSVIRITDLPSYWPPGPIDLLVEGYREDWTGLTWEITLSCSPAGPWTVGVLEDPVLGRADTDGSELLADVTAGATSWDVAVTAGPAWLTSRNLPAQFPVDVTAGGEQVTVTAITGRAEDSFTRTVSNTWGTTDTDQPWTATGGTAANRAVNGSAGTLTLSSPVSTWRIQRLGLALADCEILTTVSISQVAVGGALAPSILLRWVSDSDFYLVRPYFYPDGTVYLSLYTNAQGTIGGFVPSGYSYTANQQFTVRARIEGHRVLARIWPAAGREPDGLWHVDATATTAPNATGDVGILGFGESASTNVNPILSVHDFAIVTPQVFTVTRSVNGITKAHASGTPLSLTHPMRAAQ